MPNLATNLAENLATSLATNLAGGGGVPAGWAPDGYSANFETEAPSSIALDTVPDPDEVTSWTDSTGNYTATPAGAAPSFPYGVLANGHEAVEFAPSEALTVNLGISSTETYALFWVVRLSDAGGAQCLLESEDSVATRQLNFRAGSGVMKTVRHTRALGTGASVHDSANAFAANTIARIMISYDGANSIIRAEGSAEESQAIAAGSHDAGQSRFGLTFPNTQPLNGGFYNFLAYVGASGVPGSAVERQAVWDALGTRFVL